VSGDAARFRERTDLAWTRTGLGFLANGALMFRFAHEVALSAIGYATGLAMGLFGLTLLVSARSGGPSDATRPRAVAAVHLATLLAVVAAIAVSLLSLVA
jgi:uncharacterized membrane protein YidH (DUF202 family)